MTARARSQTKESAKAPVDLPREPFRQRPFADRGEQRRPALSEVDSSSFAGYLESISSSMGEGQQPAVQAMNQPSVERGALATIQMVKPSMSDAQKLAASGFVKKKGKKLKAGQRAGGFRFKNKEKLLPEKDDADQPIDYTEYDVNPKQAGQKRDAERVVVGSDGKYYYTGDHYKSFSEIT